MQDFRELRVWQNSKKLIISIYDVTKQFPSSEKYGLTSQIQRAVVSIAANIAEGSGYGSDAQFARYLRMSFGSSSEVLCLIEVAKSLGYIDMHSREYLSADVDIIQRMLRALIVKMEPSSSGEASSEQRGASSAP